MKLNSLKYHLTISPYSYGFNGMESDDEVKGTKNSYDFGARMYDPRIGRWLSLDPLQEKYPSQSAYNFVQNNPIYWLDLDGRDLYLGGDREKAMNDVKSIVPSKYHSLITISDNKVIFDMSTLSCEEINGDAGLTLLQGLTESKYKYLYEVSETFTRTVFDGKTKSDKSSDFPDNIITKKPMKEFSRSDSKAAPKEGFDAQITIHPNIDLYQKVDGANKKAERDPFIYHSLDEAFQIQDNDKRYEYKDGTPGAHSISSDNESKNYHNKSATPGEYTGYKANNSDGTSKSTGNTIEE